MAVDNFYIVEDVLREVKHDLPRGYYTQLPRLVHGCLAGYPRVYALALALVAHTDSSLDETHLLRFVQAYQAITPLTIGELWAVPTMLRLALIENLRRLAEQMHRAREDRRHAEGWVDRFLPAPVAGAGPSANGQTGAFARRATAPLERPLYRPLASGDPPARGGRQCRNRVVGAPLRRPRQLLPLKWSAAKASGKRPIR